jgi:hypothetical protein
VRIVLFVEGWTERELPAFLHRWLDPQLEKSVGIKAVRFEGVRDYLSGVAQKASIYLAEDDTLAVFGLLDLYGLPLSFPKNVDRDDKIVWAKQQIEARVDAANRDRFRQHFAVFETEAWLLSEPALFPMAVQKGIENKPPEEIDFDEPPSKLLDRLWWQSQKRGYKKTVQARNLFPRLNPDVVYERCPYFQQFMEEMLQVAALA